ncbi:MAG TPA: 4Fe-4S binding protein, partial [Candidatus Binatia bacterium]|nr:4Fe-4S binding protein [Candidatus Binatia bacterium]
MDAKKGRRWQRLRIGSQVLFLALFFFLLIKSAGIAVTLLPHTGFFFYIDPLHLWVNILAGPFIHLFLLALVPLALTLVLGRFFCGWVCPFGALQQFFTWLGSRRGRSKTVFNRQTLRWKYLLLIVLLLASLFATQWLGWLDPISLLTRSGSTVLLPGLNFLTQQALAAGAYSNSLAGKAVKPLYDLSRRFLLSGEQRTFLGASVIGGLFVGLLLLNFYRRRYFCNVLCPLGALYGWLCNFSLLRLAVNEKCTRCDVCSSHCTYYGGPYKDYLKSECLACMNCLADCPFAAIDVRWGLPKAGQVPALVPGRRQVLGAIGIGL